MSTCWKLLMSMLLFLTLGMAQLPSPCQGDAHGGPCRPEACVCVAGCTCHADHARAEQAAEADQARPICPHHHRPMPKARACHSGQQFPHFSLPQPRWDAAVPPVAAIALPPAPPAYARPWRPRRPAPPILAPPERPPRFLA